MHVFISYRRADTEQVAGRLQQALQAKFPQARIFLDTTEPSPGPFPVRIARELRSADIMLALIGNQWADGDATKCKGLATEDDWVRRELTAAFETDITVVPILVDHARLPAREVLPFPLTRILDQEAAMLRPSPTRDWDSDIEEIARQLRTRPSHAQFRDAEHEPYTLAIYSALVRWIIYEAELSWRVMSALLPILVLLGLVGVLPSVLDHVSRGLSIVCLIASAVGFVVALLMHSMVSRSRYFFKYRIDSATEIERGFPVPPDKAQLFRNEFFRGWGTICSGGETQRYQFSLLQQISMTAAQRTITLSFSVLLLILTLVNLVYTIRGQ